MPNISTSPKGTPITTEFRARLERALRGRTQIDLMRLAKRASQHQLVSRALEGFRLVRASHDALSLAVEAAERLDGGSNVGTPAVVVAPAPVRPALREVTSRSVLEAAIDELGAVNVLRIAAEVLGKAS